jgi:raffinose/stachyose/melibiose transport system substrate-binding protein
MKRNFTLKLLGTIAATALGLAAIVTPPASAATVTLKVWSWQKPMTDDWNKIFAVYEAANPGVKVEFTGYVSTDYPTVIKTGLTTADGPDIVMLHPYNSINQYVAAGQLSPITATDVPTLSTVFSKDSLKASEYGGKQYGVPFALQTVQMFYNKDIFKKVGVSVPKTASSFKALLPRIQKAGYTPISITGKTAWQLVNVFDGIVGPLYGGREWVEGAREGTSLASDTEFKSALTTFASYSKYFPKFVTGVDYATSQSLFSSGKAAMYPGGAWELKGFQTANPKLNMGVFSVPSGTEKTSPTWGYEDGSFGLSAKTAHRAESVKLLQWCSSKEFGQLFTNTLKQVSSVKGVKVSDPVLNQMINNYQANPVPMYWITDCFGVSSPAPYAALMNGTQELLLKTKTVDQVAKSIDASLASCRKVS